MKKVIENKTGQTVNQLIDDLKHEDIRKRQNAVTNLPVIASSLGPERTRLELIPFLNELMDDEEEVLTVLVEVLSNFLDFVGGAQHASILFAPMEALCKSDEQSVREKASSSIKKLIQLIDIKKNEDMLMNLIKRLKDSDQYFAKAPACDIIPSFYASISSQSQQELNNIYLILSKDEISIIRKQSSINLPVKQKNYLCIKILSYQQDLIKVSCPKNEDFVLQIINNLIKDEQDLIRIYLVDACVQYLKVEPKLVKYKKNYYIYQMLKSLSEDRSWRIRYYFCDKLAEITKVLGKVEFKKQFFQNYISYLEDQEPELRAVAALKLDIVGGNIEVDDIVSKLIPLVKKLSTDGLNYVRNEDSDVRISLFKQLNQITNVLGIDMLSQSIIPALTDLAQDKNWRIRQSSIEIISFFAKEIGQEFLNDKILKILMDWLQDKVYAVRESAVISVKNILQNLGSSWTEKNVMTKILNLSNQPNYLHRETVIFTIMQVFKQLNQDYINKTILPILTQLSKDPVPNIRFNVAKSLKNLGSSIRDKDYVKKILTALNEDSDGDVKYFAKISLDSL
ncbi:hypothetical protein IMG5_000620 [Ichthyophthirius multifiliis]|uniref:Phosphatase 2A Regulatory Subunit A helical domain-containing protein n=1 Tax=Ichthyophthirius multifiliis TaxID=5932 RepID=G0QIU8_ICHMU|nr:hypothetical protein IMG5_000620 [Ichthyophthirius multifiliis]EGR34834.1 hypothetical protein IMG5_000620 [Ichthyophthirius multifiliis]|eukprot:XP_004040138.1 hypothetical protein IMG5_000620 [Ichthyophthirius multifiliis]